MMAALGSRALDLDLRAGMIASPILWDDAQRLWNAPSGSPLELRGALVLLALSDAALRPWVVEVAGLVGYEAARVADLVYLRLSGDGLPVRDAPAVLLAVVKPAEAPPPVAAPQTPQDGPRPVADPYPGLQRNGEPWPAFLARGGHREPEALTPWNAARLALTQGRMAEWMEREGTGLGFTWTPPTTG